MPSSDAWTQYPIVAILILAAGIIAVAFYRLWRDLLNWIESQDVKRSEERERQRVWQAEQDKVRDVRWQEFLTTMQNEWVQQDGRHTEVLKQLITKVDVLINTVNSHDTWSRAKDRL